MVELPVDRYCARDCTGKILLDSGIQLLYNLHKYAVISSDYEGSNYEYNKSGKSRF